MTQAIDQFTQGAVNLFNNEIHDLWKTSGNVWRNGCAMDTILDYFTVCKIDPSTYADTAINSLDPTKGGNWWDDFGWIGLAALRAAEQDPWPQQYRDRFLKIAINSWAYMYGPHWSKTNTAIYPFTGADLPGWEEFATTHTLNRGAPNVWNDIEETWTNKPISEDDKMKRKARYSPGGIWNSPLENSTQPELTLSYQGDGLYVNPIQNTVTNAVFTVLSLRIYQASKNGLFSNIFNESELDTEACLQAWKDQIGWFDQWILQTTAADESMKLALDTGCLIRERASRFNDWNGQRYWDGSYCKNWIWTGDQGLLIGALREGKAAGYVKSDVLDLYPQIVEGVFKYGYKPRTYNKTIKGSFLLPWIVVNSQNPYSEDALASDVNDYQTGTGVFMRYLLQAYKAEPSLLQNHKDTIVNSANNIIQSGFGTNPDPWGSCDSFTPYAVKDAATVMTAYINRLSVLLLAIEISQ